MNKSVTAIRHEAMRIGGEKVTTKDVIEVRYPYTDEVIGTVPAGNASHAARDGLNAVEEAKATSQTINNLGISSQEIGEVVELITSIAQQTNLLAFNAVSTLPTRNFTAATFAEAPRLAAEVL